MSTFTPQPQPDWIKLEQQLPPIDKPVELGEDETTGIVDFGYRRADGTYQLKVTFNEPFELPTGDTRL